MKTGGRTETSGKDSPREAWGCRLLPVCSGISHASWQGCVASLLPCQGAAQNQEPLCPPSPLLPSGSGADFVATCCSRRDIAAAAWLGPGIPLETSTTSAQLPGKKQRPARRLQQGQDALTWVLVWPPLLVVLLWEPCAPRDRCDLWLLCQPSPASHPLAEPPGASCLCTRSHVHRTPVWGLNGFVSEGLCASLLPWAAAGEPGNLGWGAHGEHPPTWAAGSHQCGACGLSLLAVAGGLGLYWGARCSM